MEPRVKNLFTAKILSECLASFTIAPENAQILDSFESYIYNVQKEGRDYILRIGHDSRRTADLVQAESEFLNHLSQGGLSVPRVLPSENGRLVEQIAAADGSHFLGTLFTKAPGHPPLAEQWTPALFKDMGAFMGKLHQLSKVFQPSSPRFTRYDIEQDFEEMIAIANQFLPAEDQPIINAYLDTTEKIRQLVKSPDGYGLCHVDFHRGNFFLTDDGQITLFDFDDCQYAWFIYDIAMALFYAIDPDCTSPEDLAKASNFFENFWQGYQTENTLGSKWLEAIPLFLRLREIDLYFVIHRSMDMHNLDRWCARYMHGRREKILNYLPYCSIDYSFLDSQ